MLADAAEGKFDVLIMRDIDRLGGDTNRNQLIVADLIDSGVRVDEYSTGQTLDLSSPTAKMLVMIIHRIHCCSSWSLASQGRQT